MTSTPSSTQLYRLPSKGRHGELERLVDEDFVDLDTRTIAAANVKTRSNPNGVKYEYFEGSLVVQVTSKEVRLVDINSISKTLLSSWSPKTRAAIVLADITPSQICVALEGGGVVLLILEDDRIQQRCGLQARNVLSLMVMIGLFSGT